MMAGCLIGHLRYYIILAILLAVDWYNGSLFKLGNFVFRTHWPFFKLTEHVMVMFSES